MQGGVLRCVFRPKSPLISETVRNRPIAIAIIGQSKVGRPQVSLHGVSKTMECDIFPFSALTLLVEREEGHPACKKLDVGLLVGMICTTYSSSSHHHLHYPLLQ